MKVIAFISLLIVLTVSLIAQQRSPAAAPAGTARPAAAAAAPVAAFTAAQVADLIAKSPADRNALGQRMIQLAPYAVNLEHRVASQAAAIHEKEAELFYVIEGAGTIVTGGKLVGETRTNDTNLSGTSIEGGESRRISKGDWFIVPEGVPIRFQVSKAHLA